MPKWLKVVLVLLGVLVLVCGLGVGGVAWWFDKNKGALKETGERAMADGQRFAATADSEGCLSEALRRNGAEPGFMEEVEHRVFLGACLKAARVSPGFCDDAPPETEIIKSALWAQERCSHLAAAQDSCGRAQQEVLKFCASRTDRARPGK